MKFSQYRMKNSKERFLIIKFLLIYFTFISSIIYANNPPTNLTIDLDKYVDDFVLETKQIKIPGYGRAFNPSITMWKGKRLMICRLRTFIMGIVWLDDDFNVISQPQIVKIPNINPLAGSRAYDARLISIKNQLYIVYSDVLKGSARRMFVTKLHVDDQNLRVEPAECLRYFEKENKKRIEKNWVPFEYNGKLLLAYSINPHLVFKLLGEENCQTISSTFAQTGWEWGGLRGGTPALIDKDHYIAFFHSVKKLRSIQSEGQDKVHYFMGAYTFSTKPPFELKKISPRPIIGSDFYHGPKRHKLILFPGGLLMDEKYIWVTYGRQDKEMWVVKLDKKRLLKSLVNVSQVK